MLNKEKFIKDILPKLLDKFEKEVSNEKIFEVVCALDKELQSHKLPVVADIRIMQVLFHAACIELIEQARKLDSEVLKEELLDRFYKDYIGSTNKFFEKNKLPLIIIKGA